MALLRAGDTFPTLEFPTVDGPRLSAPEILAGNFGVLLFYRGSWCPYCNAQLRAFQRAQGSFAEVGARVVAMSVDDEASTRKLIAKHNLTFSIGYSVDAHAVSAATGAFVDPDRGFLQSTGFILDPDGKVVLSVYSSGAIGRLVAEDVVGMIRYLRHHASGTSA